MRAIVIRCEEDSSREKSAWVEGLEAHVARRSFSWLYEFHWSRDRYVAGGSFSRLYEFLEAAIWVSAGYTSFRKPRFGVSETGGSFRKPDTLTNMNGVRAKKKILIK
jgi:hypothetical protein